MTNPFATSFSSDFGGGSGTVSQNIHVGLVVWQQNHVYAIGQRISNANNAYQVIIAGTSQNTVGAGPTGTGSSIVDGTVTWKYLSSIDFNGIQAWANALPSALPTAYIGLLWNDGPITTSSGVSLLSLSGHTTSSSASITLTCAPGESHRDATGPVAFSSTNGVAIVLPASGAGNINYIFVADSNVTIDAIQFQDPNSGSHSSIIAANASNFRLSNCIVDGFAQPGPPSGYIIDIQAGCSSFVIDNCLVIDRQITHSSDSNTIECFASSQVGFVVNCTFIAVVNNTLSGAVEADNTNSSGVLVRNSAFFGWTVPLNALSTVGAISADHCCTDVAAFAGNVTNGGGNLFSKVATNQFINATTDFRLKAGSDCVNGGVVDIVHIPTSDDVRRTARPSSGNWDIGLFESGNLFSKSLQIAFIESIHAIKSSNRTFSSLASSLAGIAKQKISGAVKSVTLASAEISSLVKVRGLSTLKVLSSFSVAFDREFIRINITAAVLFQAIHIPRAITRSISGRTQQVANVTRLISRLSISTSSSAAKLAKSANKALAAFNVSLIASIKNIFIKRNAAYSQLAAFNNKTIGRVLSAFSTQIAFASTGTTQSIIKLLSLASSEIASFTQNLSAFRSMVSTSPQATSSFQGRRSSILTSAMQAYLAAIAHSSGHIASAVIQQVVAIIRGTAHSILAFNAEIVTAFKAVGLHQSTLSTASQTVVRVAGKLLDAVLGQLAFVVKTVSTRAGATSSQLATKFFLQTPTKVLTVASAQVAVVVRQSSHAVQAILGAAQSIVRMSARLLPVASGDAVSVGGLSAAITRSLSALSAYALSLLRGVGFSKQSVDAQSTHILTQRGFISFITIPSSTSRSSVISIRRFAISPEVVAAGKQGSGKVYQSSISSVVNITTPRSVTLLAILSPLSFLVKWYHLFIPPSQQPGVLLPPLDGPAEPPSFSAMDPADQERLVFDWSARAEPNDPISSVQVVSIPPGMNFVGPIFIEGLHVEVTLGPFSPPQLPMTYGLRCSVTFVSGRRSSYTIAIPVRIM